MEKDIRFTEKKIDDSWKDQISKEQGWNAPKAEVADKSSDSNPNHGNRVSQQFMGLLNSLGYQAMMHLGGVDQSTVNQEEVNVEAGEQMLQLIESLKEKTDGNLATEEKEFLNQIINDLQTRLGMFA